jgi:tripartite-type tricarboxylate transporter receptor subunit TctC
LGLPNLAQREWFAVFMPDKTFAATVAAASEGIRSALREPEVQELWRKTGLSAEGSTPAELQRALRNEYDFWGPIIRASGFTPEV